MTLDEIVAAMKKAKIAASRTAVWRFFDRRDLNPIEMAVSKLKALLRKAAERTSPGEIRLIGRLLKKFSPEECRNFLSHAGYAC